MPETKNCCRTNCHQIARMHDEWLSKLDWPYKDEMLPNKTITFTSTVTGWLHIRVSTSRRR